MGDYTQVRGWALEDVCSGAELDYDACSLLTRLVLMADHKTGVVAGSQTELAERLHIGRKRLGTLLQELAAKRLVVVETPKGHVGRVVVLAYPDVLYDTEWLEPARKYLEPYASQRTSEQGEQVVSANRRERPGQTRTRQTAHVQVRSDAYAVRCDASDQGSPISSRYESVVVHVDELSSLGVGFYVPLREFSDELGDEIAVGSCECSDPGPWTRLWRMAGQHVACCGKCEPWDTDASTYPLTEQAPRPGVAA